VAVRCEKMKRAMILLIAFLAVAAAFPPGTFDYVVKSICVQPDEERLVSDLYEHFLTLIAGGDIEQGTELPAGDRFWSGTPTHLVFLWSCYIPPTELRGFEISVPREYLRRNGGNYITTAKLRVDTVATKQSIRMVILTGEPTKELKATR